MALGNEVHPLFNPVILEKIFSFLQLQSLKNSRATCKLWSKVALPYLQKLSKVVLIRGGKADRDQFSFRNFLEFVFTLSATENFQLPFENFYLDHWALNEKREKSLKQFWDICGPSMKQLHLSNVIFYEVDTIQNIIYHWSPHLEVLKLEDCLFYTITNDNAFNDQIDDTLKSEDFDEPNLSYDYYDHVTVEQLKNVPWDKSLDFKNPSLLEFSYGQLEEEEFPLAWEEVFHAFPNLKVLNIASTTKKEQISKILDALHAMRQDDSNMVGSIAELKFYTNTKPNGKLELCDSHLYKISDIFHLPLTSLNFIINESISVDAIVNIVRQYGPLLQNLCLHSEEEKEGETPLLELFKYQKYPNLSKLCVSMNVLGGSFGLLESMPQLQKLYVWLREEDFSWDTPIDDVILKNMSMKCNTNPEMSEVSIGYPLGSSSQKAMTLLCTWFKNVRILMMALTDDIIRIVFKEMLNLEEITVFDRHLTDAGITGNPFPVSESSPWKAESQREFPYIGDLKKLWKFTLTFRRYENITDLSIYHGLMDVPQLSSLLLTRTKIGDKALKDLSMKATLITMVTPTVCKGIDLEYSD